MKAFLKEYSFHGPVIGPEHALHESRIYTWNHLSLPFFCNDFGTEPGTGAESLWSPEEHLSRSSITAGRSIPGSLTRELTQTFKMNSVSVIRVFNLHDTSDHTDISFYGVKLVIEYDI